MRSPVLNPLAALACVLGAITAAPQARAQWTAIRLHNPAFSGGSVLFAASGAWQGGVAGLSPDKPVLWHSSSSQWIDLAPGPGVNGIVYGMHGGYQVGSLNGHATLWSGTPESLVDLHPSWAEGSVASAIWGDEQVGHTWVGTGYTGRAALWGGSAASHVNLHPAGAVQSRAGAVAAGQQGGTVEYPYPTGGTIGHAALWSGTPESFVDLNPPGALGSAISGMWPGQQVGGATWVGSGDRAGYWTGTPESFVSLNPPNTASVVIHGTCGKAQVGKAALPATGHSAVVWFGTAESMVNLAAFLPPGQYVQSEARAVAFHNGRYYVSGTAWTSAQHHAEAFLWVGGCYSDCDGDGRLTIPDFGCFQTRFVSGDAWADCTGDGNRTIADFGCFQTAFVAGCP